jgi:hypothetical protein
MLPARGAQIEDHIAWTARIPALAFALRACLTGLPRDAFATDAGEAPAPDRGLRVRVWKSGEALDCVVRLDGSVRARRPVPGVPHPEASAPAFFLDRRCVDARRVDGPDGAVLGWLAYPAC